MYSFNALTGLSCYTIKVPTGIRCKMFQCPLGLELLRIENYKHTDKILVSMPSRAYTSFLLYLRVKSLDSD